MYSTVVVGLQWGDEGKGKVVDCVAGEQDLVVRYQGGANAGHTVEHEDYKFVLHAVPSGVFNPRLINVIGNGSVIDLGKFVKELGDLEAIGVDASNVYVASRAHVTFPYHKKLEAFVEDYANGRKIDTTGQGIGTTYASKMQRTGVRVIDLKHPDYVVRQLREAARMLPFRINPRKEAEEQTEFYRMVRDRVVELPYFILDTSRNNPNFRVMFEGAQGTMLDVDHGTYPFVTSSNASAGGAFTGTGLPPKADKVIGVLKAYTTRVGRGPFPTELGKEGDEKKGFSEREFKKLARRVREGRAGDESIGHYLRIVGVERGATTGRPRRTGWQDIVAAHHSVAINGIDEIALTKLDVLDSLPRIGMCNEYRYGRKKMKTMPSSIVELEACRPEIEYVEGWRAQTSNAQSEPDLPENAAGYVDRLEEELGVPIKVVSVGPRNSQTIRRESKLAA